MKNIIAGLLLTFTSASAFSGCLVSFAETKGGAMTNTFLNDSNNKHIIQILEQKGYTVVQPEAVGDRAVDFELKVFGYYGYGCGTGMTFEDYLTVPASYSVSFSVTNGNTVYEKQESFSRPVMLGVQAAARKKVRDSIREIPACE